MARLEDLRRQDPNLDGAIVLRAGPNGPVPVARAGSRPASRADLAGARRVLATGTPSAGCRSPTACTWPPGPRPSPALGAARSAALWLGYDLAPSDQAVAERDRRIFGVLLALLLAFTAFTAWLLGRRIFRPLDRLRVASRRIAEGRLETRLGWSRRDELGALAHDFDEMAGELEESHGRLEDLALRDPLTGLANHRRFQEALSDGHRACGRRGRPAGADHPRHRPVQADQRRLGPPGRRPGPQRGGPQPGGHDGGGGPGGAAGRRRVRDPAARLQPDPGARHLRGRARRGGGLPDPRPGHHLLGRAGHVPRRRDQPRLPHPARRRRAVLGQALGPRPLAALRPRARPGGDLRAAVGVRPGAGEPRRDHARLPADRVAPDRRDPGLRGPGPVRGRPAAPADLVVRPGPPLRAGSQARGRGHPRGDRGAGPAQGTCRCRSTSARPRSALPRCGQSSPSASTT